MYAPLALQIALILAVLVVCDSIAGLGVRLVMRIPMRQPVAISDPIPLLKRTALALVRSDFGRLVTGSVGSYYALWFLVNHGIERGYASLPYFAYVFYRIHVLLRSWKDWDALRTVPDVTD